MKKILCILTTVALLLFFLLLPNEALEASRRGLSLWFDQLLPTLLPFSILSYVILRSNLFSGKGKSRRISPEEWYVMFCGFLFGFPIGSKLTADLYREGRLGKERASTLFLFTNNLSPAFVTMALNDMLGLPMGIASYALLYGLPLALCLLRLCNTPLEHKEKEHMPCKFRCAEGMCAGNTPAGYYKVSKFTLDMKTVDAGIVNGFETLIKICGYVVLFSLAAELIRLLPLNLPYLKTCLIGCTEVTTGMQELSGLDDPNLRYVLGVGFLSWGGVSGFFQTASITSGTDLSMKRYLVVRLALALVTALVAALFCALGIR